MPYLPSVYKLDRQNQRLTVSSYLLTSDTVRSYLTSESNQAILPSSPENYLRTNERSPRLLPIALGMAPSTRCTVCNHEDVQQIHKQLQVGGSQQKVADAHGLKRSAIVRHLANEHVERVAADRKAKEKDLPPCGVKAHGLGVDLATRFEHQDSVLAEAVAKNMTGEDVKAEVVRLRQEVCERCADDLLVWLAPEHRTAYDLSDPLHAKQNYRIARR